MATTVPAVIRGTVHGKTIELENELGLPEDQPVSLVVRADASRSSGALRSA